MLKRTALMESISSNLHGFRKKIGNNLSLPDKPDFLSYRLLGGLTEAINTCFLASQGFTAEKLTRKPLSLRTKGLDSSGTLE